MSESKLAIGCAGAGVLGSAIMGRLLDCGFSVTVWNRDREKLQPLLALGAVAAETPADLAKAGARIRGYCRNSFQKWQTPNSRWKARSR